jgi:tRNA (guanine-N7-)-methyltransferase
VVNDVEHSDNKAEESSVYRRTIRSFVRRAGRVSPAQERGLREGLPIYGLPFAKERLVWGEVFKRAAPIVLEIGFGMGDATAEIAACCPHLNFIGIEVHEPGVGSLVNQIQARGLENLKVIQHDAVEVLEYMIPPHSLHGVHLFFPDPWHKTRHHKRRIVQIPFVQQLVSRLEPGGYLHFATDWEPYAHWMLEVLEQVPQLQNTFPAQRFAPRPEYRPLTKFEKRGMKLGHGVWDILFKTVRDDDTKA